MRRRAFIRWRGSVIRGGLLPMLLLGNREASGKVGYYLRFLWIFRSEGFAANRGAGARGGGSRAHAVGNSCASAVRFAQPLRAERCNLATMEFRRNLPRFYCVNTSADSMKTTSVVGAVNLDSRVSRRPGRLLTVLGLVAMFSSTLATLSAQAPGGGEDRRRRGGDGGGERGDRGNFNPQDMQARMLSSLRERFEVADDEEWKVISERIAKVSELRRSSGGGMFGMMGGRGGPPGAGGRGGPPGGGDRGGGDRGGPRGPRPGGGSSELSALSTALRDKMPDAEIKSRLDRVRETRRETEEKLAKAQEELRAVLSVRQEALAVLVGLLP